jgi:hypothetical protein
VEPGDPFTINWNSADATSCSSSDFTANKKTSGTLNIDTSDLTVREEPYIYTITCSKPYERVYGGSVTMQTTKQVEILYGVAPTCKADISANPSHIESGGSSILSWTSSEAENCSLNDASVSTSGSQNVSPTETTVYTLSCDSTDGSGPCSKPLTVSVGECITPRFTTGGLTTNPLKSQILLNQSVNLEWSVTGGENLVCTPSVVSGDGTGWVGTTIDPACVTNCPRTLSPKVTTTYRLSCVNSSGEDCEGENQASSEYTVKVYTPDLKEIPAYRSGFMKFIGNLREGLKALGI